MRKSSNLTNCLLIILALFVTHVAYPEDLDTMMLLDSWKELAKTRTQKAGKQIHDEALAQATTTMMNEDPVSAGRLLFKAAEYCRDLNDVRHAITLFELAIELNPEDPHYRRVYGDYLIGYRGLEEQAWAQLSKARKLAEQYPDKVDDQFTKTLNRSIHIFRRDTRDGVRTFERIQSDGALVYGGENLTITGVFDTIYKKVAKDPLDLSTEFLRTENFFFNNPPSTTSSEAFSKAFSAVSRRVEASETLLSLLFRTPNSNLPVVRLSYSNEYIFNSITNVDAPDDPFDLINDRFFLELEKTFVIKNDLFLEGDFGLIHQNRQTRSDLYDIEEDFLHLFGALNLRKEWGTRDGTVQLNVGGQYSRDLFDFEAYPIHQQRITLRNSSFHSNPFDNETRDRFRGRRSSSQEIGIIRDESREGLPLTTVEDWRVFVSNEELGLIDGKWDLYTTYTYRQRQLSGASFGNGTFSIHEFSVEPLWVPVFDLYDNDFVDGWEFVTIGFPIKINTDEGPYDRFIAGLTFRGQYVVSQAKLTLGIRAGIEYANYTQVNEEDFGGFIRLSIF